MVIQYGHSDFGKSYANILQNDTGEGAPFVLPNYVTHQQLCSGKLQRTLYLLLLT